MLVLWITLHSLTNSLKEECQLRGLKAKCWGEYLEIIQDRRKLCNDHLHNFYSVPNIVRIIKSGMMRWYNFYIGLREVDGRCWLDWAGLGQGFLAGFWKYNYEPPCSVKGREFLGKISDSHVSKYEDLGTDLFVISCKDWLIQCMNFVCWSVIINCGGVYIFKLKIEVDSIHLPHTGHQ